jgi:hypothetical protein
MAKKPYYTAVELRKKYSGKFINTHPLHYTYQDTKTGSWTTVYEVRGVSKTIKENFQTVEEILGN